VRCSRVWACPEAKENTVLVYGHNRRLCPQDCRLRVAPGRLEFCPSARRRHRARDVSLNRNALHMRRSFSTNPCEQKNDAAGAVSKSTSALPSTPNHVRRQMTTAGALIRARNSALTKNLFQFAITPIIARGSRRNRSLRTPPLPGHRCTAAVWRAGCRGRPRWLSRSVHL
jgi:hypothetical protein